MVTSHAAAVAAFGVSARRASWSPMGGTLRATSCDAGSRSPSSRKRNPTWWGKSWGAAPRLERPGRGTGTGTFTGRRADPDQRSWFQAECW